MLLMLKETEWYTGVSLCRQKWDYALGMMKVDGLELSPEMKKLIE